jgi:hypothetical protein
MVTVQLPEVNQDVIPAEVGIHDENNVLFGFVPAKAGIKAFRNDEFLCLDGALPRAELLHYMSIACSLLTLLLILTYKFERTIFVSYPYFLKTFPMRSFIRLSAAKTILEKKFLFKDIPQIYQRKYIVLPYRIYRYALP